MKNVAFYLLLLLVCSCESKNKLLIAKSKADKLFVSLQKGNALQFFDSKYFSKEQIAEMQKELVNRCMFNTQHEKFIKAEIIMDTITKRRYVELTYEFAVKCGDLKISTLYDITDNCELKGFHIKGGR